MITARSALLLAARITALFGRLKTDFMVSSCNKPDWGYFPCRPDRFQRRNKFLDTLGGPMAEQRSCFKTEVWVQQSEIRASLLC